MNKNLLLQCVIEQLKGDLDIAQRAAQTAYEAATAEENIAESKYDTLGLEASYLATGQARRMAEIAQALKTLQQLSLQDYDPLLGIELGALVLLADESDQQRWLLLAPDAAGLKLDWQGRSIMLISPNSPMGKSLRGQRVGDELSVQVGGKLQLFEVLEVF